MSSKRTGFLSEISLTKLMRAMWQGQRATLSAAESASTLYRFFRSKHVIDLMVIFQLAFLFLILSAILFIWNGIVSIFPLPSASGAARLTAYLAPNVGAIFAFCSVVVAWAYRSASARLGVVDLFACEISTLCRVGSLFDIGNRLVDQYDNPPREQHGAMDQRVNHSASFVSQEQYFPVFDNNARDLQLLEATVVNNITEFYTYMKAMRDALRKLAEFDPPQAAEQNTATPRAQTEPDTWHIASSNVIYLLYLAYESARKAVKDLIEFQPTAAESTIVILLTELKCYSFLLKYFGHDSVRYQRLKLREADYKQTVPRLYRDAMEHGEGENDWLPAMRTAPELAKRYEDALGEDMASAIARIGRARNGGGKGAAVRDRGRRVSLPRTA
jgi:hypothetical protein